MSKENRKILESLLEQKITIDEAEKLLDAQKSNDQPELPKFICIKVDGKIKVNVKIPVALIRNGIKLATFMPHEVAVLISDRLRRKGLDIDKLTRENLDKFLQELKTLSIDVEGGPENVKIYCE